MPGDRAAPPVRLHREIRYLATLLAFGLLVMPLLVYFAGVATLGPYDGGLAAFIGALYKAFFTLDGAALLLVSGPYLLFSAIRLVTVPLRRD